VNLLREHVQIAEFRLIKRIGSGAYGEVWLAESVTGAMRAVKIVWREDFELTKTFHREFLGIQQFEPISRGHPGLVHILHVGWNEEGGYYYCVMELADDVEHGPNIHLATDYAPRTLATDLKRHGRLDLHFCQEAGAFVADALHYMHNHGLTHRDIKPSNIIYCGGVCKLADIGLVATFGERSFVGTEGFVPPEGPGTPQADIYSLGKVVYEMTSGKDRMEFPEVPDNLDESEMPFWKNLNQVINRACAPDLTERYQTAGEFAEALRLVTDKRPVTFSAWLFSTLEKVAVLLVASMICGSALAAWRQQDQWTYRVTAPTSPPPMVLYPTPGKPWRSAFGQWFSAKKNEHVADSPLDLAQFNRYLEAELRSFEGEVVPITLSNKRIAYAVVIPAEDATLYCEWVTERERKQGRLPLAYEYAWAPVSVARAAGAPPLKKGWSAVECRLRPVTYGTVVILSTPAPAEVMEGDRVLGRTPLTLAKVRAGPLEYEVRYPGYKPEILKGTVKQGTSQTLTVKLKNIRAIIYGKPWANTLQQKLVPVGQVMIATHEVRRRDFKAFADNQKLPPQSQWQLENEAELDLPISSVTRAEAEAFCAWLTQRERAEQIIDEDHRYRLPTDDEWSMAARLPREKGNAPADRHLRAEGMYPWGFVWPPPALAANVFDETAAQTEKGQTPVPGFKDGFAGPSPVEAIRPDDRGLHGLSGNVWEWVVEDYGGKFKELATHGTVRGGAYTTSAREQLLSGYRRAVPASERHPDIGFRVILSDGRLARPDEMEE
jgi:serine/threonine protein kinase/formylglycine-generating enzyme required for sulfatase activity